ncbi:MAG TPA: M28 family metallopeptidase [Streptosporangiaceae bacterium]|nr:M28 family metallopeptidase [Streptosporangiaceae bacterium]
MTADAFRPSAARDLVAELSGPRFEGRLAGQPGGKRAAERIAKLFADLGLPTRSLEFTVTNIPVHTGPAILSADRADGTSWPLEYRTDFAVHPRSAHVPRPRTGVAVLGAAAVGTDAWVMLEAVPQGNGLARMAEKLAEAGASGMLLPQIPDQSGFLSKRMLGPPRVSLPLLSVRQDALGQLEGMVITGAATVEPVNATGANIIAEIAGADPSLADEPIVLTAHYDGVGDDPGRHFPAAGDNGSGVAVLAEIGRVLAEAAWQPARPVLLAALDAEELGAQGSRAHARLLKDAGARPQVLNVDMVGRFHDAMSAELGPGSEEIASALDRAGRLTGVPLVVGPVASDNRSYAAAGIPAVGLASGAAHYHSPLDSADLVDAEALEHAGQLLLAATRFLAGED